MDFSSQCLSSADYFTHLGSHCLPRLRRLSLRLYHVPDVTPSIDKEVDCFPSLDEAEVCFFGRWCPGGFRAVIRRLRNTRQLALMNTNLWIHGQSCCIAKTQFSFNTLRILRTALTFLSPDNIYERIQFPSLELVVLINHNLSPDMAKTGQYESYFPGVKVRFGLPKRRRDNDPKDCAASYIQNSVDMALAIENPLWDGLHGLQRTVPLSLEEVYLLFILEPILDSLGVSLERNAIEEIILKANVRISRLRCELIAMEAHEDTLTSLDIAAELLVGCLRIPEALRQIKSLRGQLVSMVELIANAVEDLSGAPFYNPTVSTADLRPFLEM
ncbi:unnamed protein product [Dibothriocephalus latus]|uniref:Uncharacterized protein n=1 Tax=Dibothriocephalus latus TaxID=60516 RepID=A0A3P7N053_DIBLA|nr:unnamed protein product [Dibothriocephalus latus]